jgi:hypothetical protein
VLTSQRNSWSSLGSPCESQGGTFLRPWALFRVTVSDGSCSARRAPRIGASSAGSTKWRVVRISVAHLAEPETSWSATCSSASSRPLGPVRTHFMKASLLFARRAFRLAVRTLPPAAQYHGDRSAVPTRLRQACAARGVGNRVVKLNDEAFDLMVLRTFEGRPSRRRRTS